MKVTVIIPVYNVEAYLSKCIESVINQTYRNIEIILINDGSTDDSGRICDEYSIKDGRIFVIHQKNQGLSAARNVGLSLMTGEYVYFLDSDDYIADETIEMLLTGLLDNNSDVAIGGVVTFVNYKKVFLKVEKHKCHYINFNTEECLKKMLLNNGFGHEACGKLYASYLWKDKLFPVGKLYEDYATIYYIIAGANKITYCKDAKYFYMLRMGSIMNSIIQEKNFMLLDISDEVTRNLIEINSNIKEEAIRLNVVTYLKLLKRILDVGYDAYPEVQNRIIERVEKYKSLFLKSTVIRRIDKIKLYALLLGKLPFYLVYTLGEFINKHR